MKSKTQQKGFTLIELMTVIGIMIAISLMVVISFNRQRVNRNVVIAQNEMVTNIRKVQSYVLSSRNIPGAGAAKFYVMTFTGNSRTYTVHAVDANDVYTSQPLETITLPDDIFISELMSNGSGQQKLDCMQVAFAAPFGQMYIDFSEDCTSSIVNRLKDPVQLEAQANKTASISLTNSRGELTKLVSLHGLSGKVIAE